MTNATRPTSLEELSGRVATLEADQARLHEENERLQTENRLLRQKLDHFIRHYFGGQRNEAISQAQLELLLQGLPNLVAVEKPAPPPPVERPARTTHAGRRVLAEDRLETQEEVIEPAEVQAQPEGWRKISEERTTQLDWVPPKIIKRVIIRPRYVKNETFALAPLPPQPIPQGMVGPGLLAQVIIAKFDDHLPLFRQAKMFARQFGVELSRQTLGGWVEQAAALLKPVYRAIGRNLVTAQYLQADETPIRYLDPDVKGQSQKGYLWVYGRPGGEVLFEWQISRSREGPEAFLKDFTGKLQTDGYPVYGALAGAREGITLVGCWAHVRRGFHEALGENKRAAWFVRQIGLLYQIESRLRRQKAGPALRQAVRSWQSQPVLNRLRRAMERVRQRTLPAGLLGDAIDYALKRWPSLNEYVADGQLEIDNNLIENAIRPSAVGKKNWLFIGHPGAGERSAIIYTLLACCRRHKINPFDYLKDLFVRLPAAKITEIEQFTPQAWAKAHAPKKPHRQGA